MPSKMPCLTSLVLLCACLIACTNTQNKDTPANQSGSPIVAAKTSSLETIADKIISDSGHSMLARALDSTDLLETLKKPGPFTVFAPSDKAFEGLPEGLFESLMTTRKNDFVNILSYHIVAGKIKTHDLKDGQKLRTLAGEELTVSIRNEKLKINGTNVIEEDVELRNGVMHVIDGILFPRNRSAASY